MAPPSELLANRAAVGLAAVAVVAGLQLIGGVSIERLERRSRLVGQVRFAATLQDVRTVLVLRRLGYSCAEIGDRTGLHPGSVRRVLRHLACKVAFDKVAFDSATGPNPPAADAP